MHACLHVQVEHPKSRSAAGVGGDRGLRAVQELLKHLDARGRLRRVLLHASLVHCLLRPTDSGQQLHAAREGVTNKGSTPRGTRRRVRESSRFRERERQRNRDTQRGTERETERERQRQRDRETERDREPHRQTERGTE